METRVSSLTKEIIIDDVYAKINNALFGGSIIFVITFLASGFNLLKSWTFVFVGVCLYALYEFVIGKWN